MRLRHIEVFHAVYNCGSITAAARHLQVSQPSVSKVLAHAEQQLGYALFERTRGKLIPTREAERLIGLVSGVFQNIDELRKVSRNLAASDTGTIRVAATPAFGIDLVPGAIAAYLQQHPHAEFEVETLHFHQAVRALNQSRVDMALVFHPSRVEGILSRRVARAEFMIAAPHDVGSKWEGRVCLGELEGLPLISLSDKGPLGQILKSALKESGSEFVSHVTAETYQMALSLVRHGSGIAVIDEITARSAPPGQVKLAGLDPPLYFDVTLIHSESEPLSVAAQKFAAHLESHVLEYLDDSA
jgi:DNA-binding transcriptional LysR family regulator